MNNQNHTNRYRSMTYLLECLVDAHIDAAAGFDLIYSQDTTRNAYNSYRHTLLPDLHCSL